MYTLITFIYLDSGFPRFIYIWIYIPRFRISAILKGICIYLEALCQIYIANLALYTRFIYIYLYVPQNEIYSYGPGWV